MNGEASFIRFFVVCEASFAVHDRGFWLMAASRAGVCLNQYRFRCPSPFRECDVDFRSSPGHPSALDLPRGDPRETRTDLSDGIEVPGGRCDMGSVACSSNFQSRPHPKLVCIFALVRSWGKIRRRAAGGDKFIVIVLF